eukprot:TRINITY_DN2926_c0_g2_i4.p1 TRINITY_DN2926_c0_g2~~TRINITY_DN2926_c0_g2_i4.p1  ORF type:complete len:506 (-),score=91.36 TRINITY_DN2926_c0_g2_i4:1134-2651(-)
MANRICLAISAACALVLALLALGAHDALTGGGPNYCDMSWMWPNYVPINMTQHSRLGDRYQLLYYRESGAVNSVRPDDVGTGTPMLFIPGNSGSSKQARSIGMELSRRQHNGEVDLYTVDFDEELSAFSGALLARQTEFVNDCIRFLLRRYASTQSVDAKPNSVVLIGHSMGGVVARATFIAPNFQVGSVNTIVTLASPHVAPPITTQASVAEFYADLNTFWRYATGPLSDVVLVSLAGGSRDLLIRSHLCDIDGFGLANQSLAVHTSAWTNVWLSADHQSSVWCNQIVVSIAAALVDLLHPLTHQVNPSVVARMNAMRTHFNSEVRQGVFESGISGPAQLPAQSAEAVVRRAAKYTETQVTAAVISRPSVCDHVYKVNLVEWKLKGLDHVSLLSGASTAGIDLLLWRADVATAMKLYSVPSPTANPLVKYEITKSVGRRNATTVQIPAFVLAEYDPVHGAGATRNCTDSVYTDTTRRIGELLRCGHSAHKLAGVFSASGTEFTM